jgi:hypothetical protein
MGIPLPEALDQVEVERTIRVDRALLYLVNGALTALTDRWRYEPTGSLTVEAALEALEAMLEDYYDQP